MNEAAPPSQLPYDAWAARALRAVVVDALDHAAREGLPGEHHFYLSFRTDHPGVSVPGHLRAKYPREMTIVLQHRFWDLKVERAALRFSVGLSFSGVPAMLVIPFAAITAFQDPHAQFGLRFEPEFDGEEDAADLPAPELPPAAAAEPAPAPAAQPQVVSLDAFRRKRD
ncbi:MAG: ClpXP protease specificity-enhancing factor SspB [Rubritepida sp.]|jgi:hypothetical protein|nr:ClpXP protease specificity-enhancing factor SspB [Rubritepida sp.]